MSRNINLMIKPSSSKCNLKCKYCFYHTISDARNVKDYGFMSEDVLEEIIKKVISYCGSGKCSIAFQGGEATLVGIEFYKSLIKFVQKYNINTKFHYIIQTNGILIDEEWAKFLKENNFLVGISLDGTKDIHNLNRVDYLNKDTFNAVLKATKLLEKYEVDFNILTVVTSKLCKKIESTYNFFKKNNFRYLQFIPCLEPLENNCGESQSYSLNASEYGAFLNKLFDLWYKDMMNNDFISIRFFDNILGAFLGTDYEACDMKGVCSCQNIIESEGSVYPCDFYTYEKYSVGNIMEETFEEIHSSEKTIKFITDSFNISSKCKQCEYKILCRGGCKRYRENEPYNVNTLCSAYYEFFSKSASRFKEIAIKIRCNN